ncbi:MAG: nucleotidyltransferase family protein [Acidobacteria bacterium]|nr:nucleotidyltransferase family protein [Acidobacteriota bacterium]
MVRQAGIDEQSGGRADPLTSIRETLESIVPVVLAAGDSTRMGYPKALLPLGGETFLAHVLGTLRQVGLARPVVVLGGAAAEIESTIREWSVEILRNPDPGRGQLSSIQLALGRLDPGCLGAMIWPVDQPAVSAHLVRRLAERFLATGAPVTCPLYGERRGHPAIFHRALFGEFMEAPLEKGPKGIILRHRGTMALVPTGEAAAVEDVDTPEDYRALTGKDLEAAVAAATGR